MGYSLVWSVLSTLKGTPCLFFNLIRRMLYKQVLCVDEFCYDQSFYVMLDLNVILT